VLNLIKIDVIRAVPECVSATFFIIETRAVGDRQYLDLKASRFFLDVVVQPFFCK